MVLGFTIEFLHQGILKTIFIDSWLTFSLLGQPPNGFKLTLIDIIILVLIAYLVSAISERLTGKKLGGTFQATVITLLGTFIILAFARLPAGLDFSIEDIQLIPALLGAILIAVFYTLIRAQFQQGKKGK
jgi:uncharacterized membrane protein YeaQ/YmgE (transglycosylase-associated protein family)